VSDANDHPLAPGDVVQIDPASGPVYGGALMLVQGLDGWVEGVFIVPSAEGAKLQQYRAESRDVVRVGRAAFRGV